MCVISGEKPQDRTFCAEFREKPIEHGGCVGRKKGELVREPLNLIHDLLRPVRNEIGLIHPIHVIITAQ